MKSKDRNTVFNFTDIYQDTFFENGDDKWTAKWYEMVSLGKIQVHQSEYLSFKENIGLWFNNSFVILQIDFLKIDNENYEGIFKEDKDFNSSYESDSVMNWSNIRKMRKFKVRFVFDGDYLYIYDSQVDGSNEELFFTFVNINTNTYNELENLIRNNKCDLSKVTWPRHADGTCDYDGSKTSVTLQPSNITSSNNVTLNKTMTVSENLKLRSGEATSTQVLTVMQAGTKVKILELGKAETIDGINSNWVKVEVQAGAKDRDGKPIKAGTVGWCYGGYLK